MTLANATLNRCGLDRLTVIRMLGSNAPEVVTPPKERVGLSWAEARRRSEALNENMPFMLGLAVEGANHEYIGALVGVTRQAVQIRLAPHGAAKFPWSVAMESYRANQVNGTRGYVAAMRKKAKNISK